MYFEMSSTGDQNAHTRQKNFGTFESTRDDATDLYYIDKEHQNNPRQFSAKNRRPKKSNC